MIGSGLKKLAKEYGLEVRNGVAFGSLEGFATTLQEGSGFKRIDIATVFQDPQGEKDLRAAVNAVDVTREYQVQQLLFGPRCITVVFTDNMGLMKKLQAFIQWFYPLLAQHGARAANVCSECGGILGSDGWYLINGAAYHLHDSCAQKIQDAFTEEHTKTKEEATGSYVLGTVGAFLGAILGSVLWAVVLYAGYVASIVGLVIGWLAEKGYNLLKGKQGKGKIVSLILAIIFGVLLGTILPDVFYLASEISAGNFPGWTYGDIPTMLMILLEDAEYVEATAGNVLTGLLFAGLGTFAMLLRNNKMLSAQKISKLK